VAWQFAKDFAGVHGKAPRRRAAKSPRSITLEKK
jgi:hypothetical protein